MLMKRCGVCKAPLCKDHCIELINSISATAVKGIFKPSEITVCLNCYNARVAYISNHFHNVWLQLYSIDHCMYCGESTKLMFSVYKRQYAVPAFTDHNMLSFMQLQIDCAKCHQTFCDTVLLFNYPNRELTHIRNLIKPFSTGMEARYKHYSDALKAKNAGRYEDAAKEFEAAGFADKAKELRDSARVVHHEHTHVTLDVNQMLEELGRTNFTIPYKCPNCGAVIKLNKDRDASNFLTCEYCNSSLKAVDIKELMSQML